MALTIRAAARRTHKYRDGWASLDDWSENHRFKMLGGCVVREGNGIDDEGAILHRVKPGIFSVLITTSRNY